MTIDVEIDIECEECNAPVKATFSRGVIYVKPCKDCIDAAIEEATDAAGPR